MSADPRKPENDEAAQTVRGIVLRAAAGHQDEALGELLGLTGSTDPATAWLAAAAAFPGMSWQGAHSEASDMVERIVERFGAVAGELNLSPVVPFSMAVAAGALYDGSEGVARLLGMAEHLPPMHQLHRDLIWAAGHFAQHGPAALMPHALRPSGELLQFEAVLLDRGPARLTEAEARSLWLGAASAGRSDVLMGLHEAGSPLPRELPVMYAFAQTLFEAGRPFEAEQVLLEARVVWYPMSIWETLPTTPVLNPGLRPVVTERVRTEYFTMPIGEMVPR